MKKLVFAVAVVLGINSVFAGMAFSDNVCMNGNSAVNDTVVTDTTSKKAVSEMLQNLACADTVVTDTNSTKAVDMMQCLACADTVVTDTTSKKVAVEMLQNFACADTVVTDTTSAKAGASEFFA